ncbi:MAG: hypothetical protein V1897_18845 [Pseudomonadota bacterium]
MANRFLVICGGTGYKLLGQRTVLGIDAELQVDVSKENVSRDWKVKDQRSLFVDLDQRVGTTAVVFNAMIEKFKDPSIKGDEDKNHAQLLADHFSTASNLERGLAQSPAVGRATIEHPYNERALEQAIKDMLTKYGQNIGPENPAEVWIISSTAGGTGEGTHCFVARKIAESVKETFTETTLTMNFIRVGQLTYRSVSNDKTALNTFFGVAADAAFMLRIKKEFPAAVTNWFYVDLPDVGMGDKAKRVRGEIVEMACKAIMLPEMQDDLQKLLVNRVGAPIVLVRTGYWGRDFGSNQKYLETLKQLTAKLTDLTEPNYKRKYIEGKPEPQVSVPGLDDRSRDVQNAKYVLGRMEKGWTFPRYRLAGIPKDLGQIEAIVSDWKISMRDLVDTDIDHLTVEFRVDELSPAGDKTQRVSVPLNVPLSIQEDAEWFNQINDAHRVKGWADHLLGVDFKDRSVLSTGWIADLLQLGKQISKVIHGFNPLSGSSAKAREVCGLLGTFLATLVRVNRLLELEKSATRLLVIELSEIREVLKKTNEEYKITKETIGPSSTNVVNAAELNDVLDQLSKKTWLWLLRDAVRKGDTEQFRSEVLRGATGLTEDGLRSVLGLQSNADIVDIQNTLATKMGHIMGDNKEEYEGQWWQATKPTPTLEYQYRIFPQVDPLLQARLRARADEDNVPYRYVFTKFGTIGLYVLAFHGVSLNEADGDTVSAPAFLLNPLASQVKGALANWLDKLEPHITSGQLQIGAAGSGGEPLYERALRKIGLTDEEIEKIGQYYKLYN